MSEEQETIRFLLWLRISRANHRRSLCLQGGVATGRGYHNGWVGWGRRRAVGSYPTHPEPGIHWTI